MSFCPPKHNITRLQKILMRVPIHQKVGSDYYNKLLMRDSHPEQNVFKQSFPSIRTL